jgi:Holliday junction resolvasome RuvABC DNA-binding subunit
MISYLKGTVADITKGSNRIILTLEVNQIGYEIQAKQGNAEDWIREAIAHLSR